MFCQINLLSANKDPEIIRQKIAKELEAGRITGPFKSPPFTNFRVSLILAPSSEFVSSSIPS